MSISYRKGVRLAYLVVGQTQRGMEGSGSHLSPKRRAILQVLANRSIVGFA